MRFYGEAEEEDGEAEEEATAVGPVITASSRVAGDQWGPCERVLRMAQANAVVVFSASGCCMCHVVKRLLLGLGVGPTVYEVDQLGRGGPEIQAVLSQLVVGSTATTSSSAGAAAATGALPAVFVGGKLLGGVEKVMACHINGSLVPLLKQAGALWL